MRGLLRLVKSEIYTCIIEYCFDESSSYVCNEMMRGCTVVVSSFDMCALGGFLFGRGLRSRIPRR